MESILKALFSFLRPVISFFLPLGGLVSLILGALADPQGFANQFICGAIDLIAEPWPSTPDSLKISALIDTVAGQMPVVGRAIVWDTFSTIVAIASISLIIKIYKLIPFKMT